MFFSKCPPNKSGFSEIKPLKDFHELNRTLSITRERAQGLKPACFFEVYVKKTKQAARKK